MHGSIIRELRETWNLCRRQLADNLSVTSKAVQNWEEDRSTPSADHIIALAMLFAVNPGYILGIEPLRYFRLDAIPLQHQKILMSIFQAYLTAALQSGSSNRQDGGCEG